MIPIENSGPLRAGLRSPARDVQIRSYTWRQTNGRNWDQFVQHCGGSFLGSWPVLRIRRLSAPITFIDFYLKSGTNAPPLKIAQCAATKRGSTIELLDRIHILPEHEKHWRSCFFALVKWFGADVYVYGSLWNCEPTRCFDFDGYRLQLAPVEKAFRVHVIATKKWQTFEAYLRGVSHSVRYEYKQAITAGTLRTEVWRGWRAVRCVPDMMYCRRAVMQKLGDRFVDRKPALIEATRLICKLLLFGQHSFISLARDANGQCMSAFVGIEFGNRIYYINGGTKPNRMGAGTLTMLNVIKYLFTKPGGGELLLGACWGDDEVEQYKAGTLLYRRKLRVEAHNGIYDKITLCRAEARVKNDITRIVYRYLRPWIPLAGLAGSGMSVYI